jgi:hypothetical protein
VKRRIIMALDGFLHSNLSHSSKRCEILHPNEHSLGQRAQGGTMQDWIHMRQSAEPILLYRWR